MSLTNVPFSEWLQHGSYLEDESLFGCIAANHFHNPRMNWVESRVKDLPSFFKSACAPTSYPFGYTKSNPHWATGYSSPQTKSQTTNQWDWDAAREYYYIYLTGMDFKDNTAAITKTAREYNFSKSLRALGQVIHLLQDMAVPAHTRDDFMSHMVNYSGKFLDYSDYLRVLGPRTTRLRPSTLP